MLAGDGASTVAWTRRTLSVNGQAGTAVDASPPVTHQVRVAQVSAKTDSLFGSESWRTAAVRLVVSAAGLPFANELHSGTPEVRFDDVVRWLGVDMRVTFLEAWAAPGGPGAPPQPCVVFVGLGA
jgi:hypothetical protein